MSEDFDHKAGGGQVRAYPWPDSPTDQGGQDQSQQVRERLGNPGDGPGQCPMEPDTGQERRFYVYFLRRPDKEDPLGTGNGCPFYVGKGQNGRIDNHRKDAEKLKGKPGRKSIRIIIIHKLWRMGLDFQEDLFCENLTEQEAFEIEMDAIRVYGRLDIEAGCLANMTNGGDGTSGLIRTEESKQKIRDILKGRKNGPPSQEHRRKISMANKGRKHTEEAKQKIRDVAIGRGHTKETREKLSRIKIGSPAWNKGIPQSETAKEKNRLAHKGENSVWLGKTHTIESKKKASESLKRYWQKRKENENP